MENLLFDLKDLKLERITKTDGRIIINTATTAIEAACLKCREPSTRIHSRYQRTLADLPCSGRSRFGVSSASIRSVHAGYLPNRCRQL
jgi:hypothetical protein